MLIIPSNLCFKASNCRIDQFSVPVPSECPASNAYGMAWGLPNMAFNVQLDQSDDSTSTYAYATFHCAQLLLFTLSQSVFILEHSHQEILQLCHLLHYLPDDNFCASLHWSWLPASWCPANRSEYQTCNRFTLYNVNHINNSVCLFPLTFLHSLGFEIFIVLYVTGLMWDNIKLLWIHGARWFFMFKWHV